MAAMATAVSMEATTLSMQMLPWLNLTGPAH